MKQTYQTPFRPNFELRLSFVWFANGIMAGLVLHLWLEIAIPQAFILTALFYCVGLYYLTFAKSHAENRRRMKSTALNFLSHKDLQKRLRDGAMFLGMGFDWTAGMAQEVANLYQSHEDLDAIRSGGKGATFLHGLGVKKEKPVYVEDVESKGHTLIVGTTGAGKTRLFDLLVTQSVLRGEATIIIDPKGDHELKANCEAAYRRVGRPEDFAFFHPAFPDESCAIDPLANYQRESELASRVAAIIPSDGKGDVFQSYSQNALMSIFYGIIAGGEPPTLLDIHEPLTQGSARITFQAIERWAARSELELPGKLVSSYGKEASPEKKADIAVAFYQRSVAENDRLRDHDLDGLVGLYEHDATHFGKMVASLIPVVGQLCAGPLKELLSPSVQKGRLPRSGRVINLANTVSAKRGVYIGLDTLSDGIVGSRIGQMVLSDLTALAGQKYNFGSTGDGFVNIFVDEASEVVTDKLIQLLNKGRGASFRLFVATQTLADFEARAGSKAIQEMMVGNMNSVVMLRTINVETQEALAKQLPEVPISYIMKTASTSLNERSADAAFGVSHGERLMQEKLPLISPQTFGDLSDLEFFMRTPRGRIVKGRLPILEAPDADNNESLSVHIAKSVRGQSQDDEAEQPDTSGGVVVLGCPPSPLEVSHPAGFPAPVDRAPAPEVEPMQIAPSQFPPDPGKLHYWWSPLRWITIIPGLRDIDRHNPSCLDSK